MVNDFYIGETAAEVKEFKKIQKRLRMNKGRRAPLHTLSGHIEHFDGDGNAITHKPSSPETMASATTNAARIAHTEEKLEKIRQLQSQIDKNVIEIKHSKPIVTAKWQPALPT